MIIRSIALCALLLSSLLDASDRHHSSAGHYLTEHKEVERRVPKEAGQDSFAALAEIVSLLIKDLDTDWASVDIGRLREHLVDMNQLILYSRVETRVEKTKVVFTITGTGRTLRAIKNMVPAHSAQLAQITPWRTKVLHLPEGVVFTSDQKKEIQKLSALGFFGVMVVGSHHQRHHLEMAKGQGYH